MRILSWNINGIRTMPQYHPWYALKTCEAMLQKLEADIICFQEMKTSRSQLDRPVALPGAFDGYFSFPVAKGGYSGVAVYSDNQKCTPLKAEEGLTGLLQPKPALSDAERISSSSNYPDPDDFDFYPEDDGTTPASFDSIRLDQEGRAILLDYGLFVLINVYCPAVTSDTRLPFKVNFHRLLEKRVQGLLREGREVIVLGDINVTATLLDYGDGSLASKQKDFWEHPARAWFKGWIDPEGPMVDAIRKFHPGREGMYTCWSTLLSAREANYGSRIDYILITKGLLPWLKYGDIQSDIRGSDHCPVYIDLHDEITLPSGETYSLVDALNTRTQQGADTTPPLSIPPRICARQWDEFSGKQKLLSNFFQKKTPLGTTPIDSERPRTPPTQLSISSDSTAAEVLSQPSATAPVAPSDKALGKRKQSPPAPSEEAAGSESTIAKRPKPPKKKKSSGQGTIASYFSQSESTGKANSRTKASSTTKSVGSSSSKSTSAFVKSKPPTSKRAAEIIELSTDEDSPTNRNGIATGSSPRKEPTEPVTPDADQIDADYLMACALADEESGDFVNSHTSSSASSSSASQGAKEKTAWKTLLAPLKAPLCTVHKEPGKYFVVNKPGPNKGKAFYVCARPVGPGYDKGRAERLREEVNPLYRCDFFKWASEVRKEALNQK